MYALPSSMETEWRRCLEDFVRGFIATTLLLEQRDKAVGFEDLKLTVQHRLAEVHPDLALWARGDEAWKKTLIADETMRFYCGGLIHYLPDGTPMDHLPDAKR